MASSTGTEGLGPCWQACPIDPETKSRAMDCAARQAETHAYVNHTLLCSDTCVRVLGSPPTRNPRLWRHGCHPTMISMELQRDVPQYMAIPWLMTWVMARTVSVREKGKHGVQAQPGDGLQMQVGVPGGGSRLQRHLASSVLPGSQG